MLDLDKLERRGPAEAAGARRGDRASSAPAARTSSRYGTHLRPGASTTSPPRRMRSISIPLGFVLLDGYDRYRMYLKDALDKLGVDINVFRVGTFKSAVEPSRATTCRPRIARRASAYLDGAVERLPAGGDQRAQAHRPTRSTSTSTRYAQAVAAAKRRCGQVALQARLVTGAQDAAAGRRSACIELVGEDDDSDSFNAVAMSRLPARDARAQKQRGRSASRRSRRHRGRGRDPRRRSAAGHDRRRLAPRI